MDLNPWLRLAPLDGAPPLTPLADGDYVLGADPTCDRVIRADGVSRRHARLTVRDGRVDLLDLGSKNGTWIDDARVERGALRPGAVLGLGRARYRVERHAPLAFRLGDATPRPATRTTALQPGEAVPPWWPQLFADLLTRADDPSAAVRHLRDGLGADALWVVSWSPAGDVVVHAADGPRPVLDDPVFTEARRRVGRGVERGLAGPGLAWALTGPADAARAAIIAGPFPGWFAAPAMAEAVLHALRPGDAPRVPPPDDVRAFPDALVRCPSPAMKGLYAEVRRFAAGRLPVLVQGETGTGKEHVAALLTWSPRSTGPLVAVNCATIPRDLLEAELFGVSAGAATGVSARPGRVREADGGVLLLDEVAELTPAAQAALLRVLQERRVQPVGAGPAVDVDVRVIAATNAPLAARVADGTFRADLYYRVAAVTLHVPPLRDRPEDIAPLAAHFAALAASDLGRPVRGMTLSALRALEARPWPGNVRELQHAVTRMVYEVGDDGLLDAAPAVAAGDADDAPEEDLDLDRHVAALERRLLADALRRTGGNRSQAARLLGLSRNGLKARLERYGLDG